MKTPPLSLNRQVHIVAGSMSLAGLLLAWLATPWFLVLNAMVTFGLLLDGTTGQCPMMFALKKMPWNR